MDNNKKDKEIKSKIQEMESEILEILDDDNKDIDQKQLRESLIDSGRLPKGCQLNGRVAMIMILNLKDPCEGCNFDKEKCGGKEYDPEKLAIKRVQDFKGYLEEAWLKRNNCSLTDIFQGGLGEFQKRFLFDVGAVVLPVFSYDSFAEKSIVKQEQQRLKTLRMNRMVGNDFREEQAKGIIEDVKTFLDMKIYAGFKDRYPENNCDFRNIKREDLWEAFLGVYLGMVREDNGDKLWELEPNWRKLNFRIVLPVDFFMRLRLGWNQMIANHFPEFTMVNYEKVISFYHHDKIGDVRGDKLGYKIFLIRETEALILPMRVEIERGVNIERDNEYIWRHQEIYNMEFKNARINLGGDRNVVVRRVKW